MFSLLIGLALLASTFAVGVYLGFQAGDWSANQLYAAELAKVTADLQRARQTAEECRTLLAGSDERETRLAWDNAMLRAIAKVRQPVAYSDARQPSTN